jgi:hypothetical protein
MLRSFYKAASALALNYHPCNFADYSRYKGLWIGHTNINRLYLDWRKNNWQVRMGRQRINWGVNLVSNPNDLFNTYSFFDFDYTERPGADALRVKHFLEDMWRVQAAVSLARNSRQMLAAAMPNLNHLEV